VERNGTERKYLPHHYSMSINGRCLQTDRFLLDFVSFDIHLHTIVTITLFFPSACCFVSCSIHKSQEYVEGEPWNVFLWMKISFINGCATSWHVVSECRVENPTSLVYEDQNNPGIRKTPCSFLSFSNDRCYYVVGPIFALHLRTKTKKTAKDNMKTINVVKCYRKVTLTVDRCGTNA
jgi:hypothetical protein